jgi:serine/threonine protein kinase
VSAAAALLADYERNFRTRRFSPGDELQGGYRVTEFLARGGMAEVYAVTDRAGRQVVAKIASDHGGNLAIASRQMQRERIALERVRHPAVVELQGAGEHQKVPFVVLERLHGRTLRGLLAARGRLPAAEVVAIGKTLAEVLGRCHVAGVIHRDVKPDNVFFVRGGGLKLHDFGAARLPAEYENMEARSAGNAPVWIGTPEYMAPESAQGVVQGDERTEIYSLGVLLFELLTATVPFEGTLAQVLLAQHSAGAPGVRSRRLDVPIGLAEVVDRCLLSAPAERFQSMAELLVALSLAQEFPNEPQRRERSASGIRPRAGEPHTAGPAPLPEIRRAPRAAYTTPAVFGSSSGATTAGRLEEISAGGAQFVSLTPIPAGTTGELRFALPMSGRVCRSHATVRWEKLGRGGLRVVGIELHDAPPDALAVIDEYVRLMGGS